MAKIDKARFWTGVLYPENMREDWEMVIGDVLQYPYAYCKHTQDKDSKSEHRKDHVHIIIAFPNTTTYKHAFGVFDLLSADGKKAINKCEACISIRGVYDYLIHDTDACRKQGKELYPVEARITGNNFDIGGYEQLGVTEKNQMFLELGQVIRTNSFYNYMDFYEYVIDNFDDMNYVEVMRCYSSHFQRMCDGNFQRYQQGRLSKNSTKNTQKLHENSTEEHENSTETPRICCPECGSLSIMKSGKTLANTQRWACKDCGKRFT